MTTQNTTTNVRDIVIAGAAAEGHGALTGWQGAGTLTRAEILEMLAAAELPESWAPGIKSDLAHAANAVAHPGSGFLCRRAETPRKTRKTARDYRARWIVMRSPDGDVGEQAGEIVLVAELRDGSNDLYVANLPEVEALAVSIRANYAAARAAEVYSAVDITRWLRDVLTLRCRSARFGGCYYVPREGRDVASRLLSAVSVRWGTAWIAPLLPVASSAELAAGIARGFSEDVAMVAADLETAREVARQGKRSEVSPTVAARLLRELDDVSERAQGYVPLCGDTLNETKAQAAALREILRGLAGAGAARFAQLDMEPVADLEPVREVRTYAARGADAALNARRQAAQGVALEQHLADDWTPPGLTSSIDAYRRSLELA
jgi:hypothetical protein